MTNKKRDFILGHKVVKTQFCLGLLCVIVVGVITRNYNSMISALTGMGLVMLPTILYAIIAFSKGVVAYPEVALGRHQKAMVMRFLLNFALFALVLIYYRQCNFLVLFITYFVTISGYWFSLIGGSRSQT